MSGIVIGDGQAEASNKKFGSRYYTEVSEEHSCFFLLYTWYEYYSCTYYTLYQGSSCSSCCLSTHQQYRVPVVILHPRETNYVVPDYYY